MVTWPFSQRPGWALATLVLIGLISAAGRPVVAETSEVKPSPGRWIPAVYRWYYNPTHAPSWLSADDAKELMIRSARKWDVCGVVMAYQGELPQPPGKIDNINVVGWSLRLPRKLRGLTVGRATEGRLLERDIAIHSDRQEFRRSPRLLEKVVTHEFGHAIGLTHAADCDQVMTLAANCPPIEAENLPLMPQSNDLARCKTIYLRN